MPSLIYFSLHWRRVYSLPTEEVDGLVNVNWETYARRFAQINPALRFIAFTPPFRGPMVAWQVSRGDQYYTDPAILTALSPLIARQVMDEQCL